MAFKKGVAEILRECSEITGTGKRQKQVKFLQNNTSPALKAVVGFCFDPKIKWMLPEGTPPYNPQPKEMDLQTQLYADHRKLHIFVESVEYHKLPALKRELQFVQFLEALDPHDAKLIVSIKNGKMPYEGITKKLAQDAFPGISKDW